MAASRLAGAYQHIGRENFGEQIVGAMNAAGYDVKMINPFLPNLTTFSIKEYMASPYKARIISMWCAFRENIIDTFPQSTPNQYKIDELIERIDEIYVNDAYHSLSIEGYRVSKDLIAKIKEGNWNPDNNEIDRDQRNAMAAKGYYNAFIAVKESIRKIFAGENIAKTIKHDMTFWYQELFSPSIDAGLVERKHLAGYRNDRVFIKNHCILGPPKEAVLDCVEAFFECLSKEDNPVVRAILGHFIFVFIHPYMDGNGRIGRFIMNVLWVTAGYPWTIVRLESRMQYLQSLEKASVDNNITDFIKLIANEMAFEW